MWRLPLYLWEGGVRDFLWTWWRFWDMGYGLMRGCRLAWVATQRAP